jgi:hypothetical protein
LTYLSNINYIAEHRNKVIGKYHRMRRVEMKRSRLQRVLDRVLNPQGQPIHRAKSSSIFAKEDEGAPLHRQEHPVHGIKPLSMAPRLDTLNGKTVYLVDIGFGGGYEFLNEMQSWFSKNKPSVKTVLKRKTGNMFMDDSGLWVEIKEKGDAVVLGVGG